MIIRNNDLTEDAINNITIYTDGFNIFSKSDWVTCGYLFEMLSEFDLLVVLAWEGSGLLISLKILKALNLCGLTVWITLRKLEPWFVLWSSVLFLIMHHMAMHGYCCHIWAGGPNRDVR